MFHPINTKTVGLVSQIRYPHGICRNPYSSEGTTNNGKLSPTASNAIRSLVQVGSLVDFKRGGYLDG
jgi:hypothetical protein